MRLNKIISLVVLTAVFLNFSLANACEVVGNEVVRCDNGLAVLYNIQIASREKLEAMSDDELSDAIQIFENASSQLHEAVETSQLTIKSKKKHLAAGFGLTAMGLWTYAAYRMSKHPFAFGLLEVVLFMAGTGIITSATVPHLIDQTVPLNDDEKKAIGAFLEKVDYQLELMKQVQAERQPLK